MVSSGLTNRTFHLDHVVLGHIYGASVGAINLASASLMFN